MSDDDQARGGRAAVEAHEIGMDLDRLSVDDLTDRIAQLEAEIARLRQAIDKRSSSRATADSVFKI